MSSRTYHGPEPFGPCLDFVARFMRGCILWAALSVPSVVVAAVPAAAVADGSVRVLLSTLGFVLFVVDPAVCMACAFSGACFGVRQRPGRPPEPPVAPSPPPPEPGGVEVPVRSVVPDVVPVWLTESVGPVDLSRSGGEIN